VPPGNHTAPGIDDEPDADEPDADEPDADEPDDDEPDDDTSDADGWSCQRTPIQRVNASQNAAGDSIDQAVSERSSAKPTAAANLPRLLVSNASGAGVHTTSPRAGVAAFT
jgi:hypothetical protein